MKRVILLATLALSTGIHAKSTTKVIYGIDNRLELRKSPFSDLNKSVAGMVDKSSMVLDEQTQEYDVKYFGDMTFYRGANTCEDFRFRQQATLPNCTGFLVDEDILVTAGHCMIKYSQKVKDAQSDSCSSNLWVFGFEDNSENDKGIKFKKNDVYECESVIEASYTSNADFAVVKLKRKTQDKTPVKLSANPLNYEIGSDIFVVGHPTGLPLKVAGGAKIAKNLGSNMFVSNLDTFAGNSGSPIFNYEKEVVGILVSGETDYYYDRENKCVRPNLCNKVGGECNVTSTGFATGETGTKIHLVKTAIEDYKKRIAQKEQADLSQNN